MYTPIQLDKTRNLRYSIRAIDRIEKQFNKNFFSIDYTDLSVEQLASIVWAGLFHEDASLTIEKVMDLIDEHSTIAKASSAMNAAFEASFGTSEGK